jgi:hypothetical protein
MSLIYECDRCAVEGHVRPGSQRDPGPFPPENWRLFRGPVRGSGGARSDREYVICDACDDALYEWLYERTETR